MLNRKVQAPDSVSLVTLLSHMLQREINNSWREPMSYHARWALINDLKRAITLLEAQLRYQGKAQQVLKKDGYKVCPWSGVLL